MLDCGMERTKPVLLLVLLSMLLDDEDDLSTPALVSLALSLFRSGRLFTPVGVAALPMVRSELVED